MEWVETTGRTIAEALDAALDELGVDEDDVEYEVLEEPKSGLPRPARQQRGPDPGAGEADLAGEAGRAPAPRSGRGSNSRPAVAASGSGRRQRGRSGGARSGAGRRRVATAARGGRRLVEPSAARRPDRGGDGGGGRGTSRPAPAAAPAADATTSSRGAPWTPPRRRADRGAGRSGRGLHPGAGRRLRPRRPRSKSVIDDDVVLVEVTGDNLGLLVGPEGRDPARDRGARAHRRAAPDRRSRRADPRRRRRLPGQAPGGARGVHPRPGREGARDGRGPGARADVGAATARSSTTPRPRSTASPPSPRARTRAAAWCCARPDPARPTLDGRTPTRAGGEPTTAASSRRPGSSGSSAPGPVERQLEHAVELARAIGPFAGRFLDLGQRRRAPRAGARRRVPGGAPACLLDAQQRRCEFLRAGGRRGSASATGSTVACGRAEALARDPSAPGTASTSWSPGRSARPAVTAECAVGFLRSGGTLVVTRAARRRVARRRAGPAAGLAGSGFGPAERVRRGETAAVRMMLARGRRTIAGPRRDGIPAKRPLW